MAKSWELATSCNKLKWLIFIPSFVAVFVFVVEVAWQTYLSLGEFGITHNEISFQNISDIFETLISHNLLGWAIFGLIFFLLFIFLVPSWLHAVLIKNIQKKIEDPEKKLLLREHMMKGFEHFFPLFELHGILTIFSPWSIILFMATFYRYFHDSLFLFLKPIIVIYFIFAAIFTMFVSFAPFYIVCKGESVSKAMRKSIRLVFMNVGKTSMIFLLMFLVNFRVVLNVILILGIPIFIMAAFSYFTASVAWTASVIFSIIMLGLVGYLTAILEIFSTAFWTKSFLMMDGELGEEKDKKE